MHDARHQQRETLVGMLKLCVMPRLNSLVGEQCKSLLEPIEEGIPEDMKDFVDPYEVRCVFSLKNHLRLAGSAHLDALRCLLVVVRRDSRGPG